MHAAAKGPNYPNASTYIDFASDSFQSDLTEHKVARRASTSPRLEMDQPVKSNASPSPNPQKKPYQFDAWLPIQDDLRTETSELQDKTVRECLPFLDGSASDFFKRNGQGLPHLTREIHIEFLQDSLEDMPAEFVGFDSSRPWIIYWALTALSLLAEDIEPYRERVVQTVSAMQNVSGGFGGGHGQISHCASSYAAILSLAMLGGSDCLDLIDRKAL
ncbi:MAG: hypothetical protein Q9219_002168 [cf. Caloplaca sp. 3 TL-2023]